MRSRSLRAPALSETGSPRPGKPARELLALVAVWVVVSLILTTLAVPESIVSRALLRRGRVSCAGQGFSDGQYAWRAHDQHGIDKSLRPSFSAVCSGLSREPSSLGCSSRVFFVFGPSIAVLRLTALFWCSIGLLLCMLWTRKLLGLPAALLVAPAARALIHPSILSRCWIGVPSMPAFLPILRLLFFLLWWRKGRLWHALLAAVCLGIGFLNKIDFVVILVGCGIAVAITWRKEVLASMRASRGTWGLCCLAFLLGAGPMTGNLWGILQGVVRYSGPKGEVNWPKELLEKINVAGAMYDGSYFFRMSDVGGRFARHVHASFPGVESLRMGGDSRGRAPRGSYRPKER